MKNHIKHSLWSTHKFMLTEGFPGNVHSNVFLQASQFVHDYTSQTHYRALTAIQNKY